MRKKHVWMDERIKFFSLSLSLASDLGSLKPGNGMRSERWGEKAGLRLLSRQWKFLIGGVVEMHGVCLG